MSITNKGGIIMAALHSRCGFFLSSFLFLA